MADIDSSERKSESAERILSADIQTRLIKLEDEVVKQKIESAVSKATYSTYLRIFGFVIGTAFTSSMIALVAVLIK